jgi:hypothetical protein
MQFMNNGFNILNVNGLVHIHTLIIKNMWKKLTCFTIYVGS